MVIVQHRHLHRHIVQGESCCAVADRSLGVRQFEVRLRTIDAGAAGAGRRHAGELVVLVLAGCGKLLIDGGPQRFSAPCTVLVPPHRPFRFVNDGVEALQLVVVGSAAERPPD